MEAIVVHMPKLGMEGTVTLVTETFWTQLIAPKKRYLYLMQHHLEEAVMGQNQELI